MELFSKRRALAFFFEVYHERGIEDPGWDEDDLVLNMAPTSLGDPRRRNLAMAPMAGPGASRGVGHKGEGLVGLSGRANLINTFALR